MHQFVGQDGGQLDTLKHPRAYELTCAIAGIGQKPTVGFALLQSNVTVSTGNMFFQCRLWEEIGGFRDLRYNHDWDFALRALWLEEPCFVEETLYRYRLHGENTITETGGRDPALEAHRIVRAYIERSLVGEAPPDEFAPSLAAWGGEFAWFALESGSPTRWYGCCGANLHRSVSGVPDAEATHVSHRGSCPTSAPAVDPSSGQGGAADGRPVAGRRSSRRQDFHAEERVRVAPVPTP